MADLDAFANFDPLTSELPSGLQSAFGTTVKRARGLLTQRTKEQIHHGLESLAWMLGEGDELLRHRPSPVSGDENCFGSSDAKRLCHLMDYLDISEQAGFPKATWVEYFAILALSLVGEAINVSLTRRQDPNLDINQARLQKAGWITDLAIEAMDAVTVAETLAQQQTSADASDRCGLNKIKIANQF